MKDRRTDGRSLIAWNIRRIRVEQGLSQERLAVDANLDRTYVGRLERLLENPTIGTLDRLATALGVRLSDLVAEPKRDAQPPAPLRSGRRPKKQHPKHKRT
jgi:transcriptional regulator with XRE-family HTH domain